jgi:hypothetical protein
MTHSSLSCQQPILRDPTERQLIGIIKPEGNTDTPSSVEHNSECYMLRSTYLFTISRHGPSTSDVSMIYIVRLYLSRAGASGLHRVAITETCLVTHR